MCQFLAHLVKKQFFSMQAPIALADLGRRPGERTGGFVHSVRDALFGAFMDSSARTRQTSFFRAAPAASAQAASSTRLAIITVFKVLGGRLLGQLHARAARQAGVPDVWFHAPTLQHEQFRKGAASNWLFESFLCFTSSLKLHLLHRCASSALVCQDVKC